VVFSESLRANVRSRAHFQCCLCKALGVEVHHIIPLEEGGPDLEENAAPLCPSCHEVYGGNPHKRKLIRESRDLWFTICEKRYTTDSSILLEIKDLAKNALSRHDLEAVKQQLLAAMKQSSHVSQGEGNPPGAPSDVNHVKARRFLEVDDLLVLLYNIRSERKPSQVNLLLLEELWKDDEEYWKNLTDFTKSFGERAAAKLAIKVLDDLGIPLDPPGLTVAEISRAALVFQFEISAHQLLLGGFVRAWLREDGAVVWDVVRDIDQPAPDVHPISHSHVTQS